MKILITGSQGFVAKNLISELKNRGYDDLCFCHRETSETELKQYVSGCDFIFHFAGVNRPQDLSEYAEGNFGFTFKLLQLLRECNNRCPIVYTSSTQALLDNPYGKSKLEAEKELVNYAIDMADGAQKKNLDRIFIVRLTNVFGKWCKPAYNSVVATFCHNIARDMPIEISNRENHISLVYIDDVIQGFLDTLENFERCGKLFEEGSQRINQRFRSELETDGYHRYYSNISYDVSVGHLADLLQSFKESRKNLKIPDMGNPFIKKLYSTYLSYLPEESFAYPLKMNWDHRGSFTEFIKSPSAGQVSVNISKPGIIKGEHWHHTKNEKFLVVSGQGIIRFRKMGCKSNPVIEYKVSGDRLEVIDIPVGYTHNIENTGDTDMVTIMWVNEPFDPENPDTYGEKVYDIMRSGETICKN